MEKPSQLESFLHSQHTEGQLIDEGSFTLAKEKALNKLASYRLPFEGAWAIKLIQSAIRGGASQSIKIELGRRESRFYFQGPSAWTLDLVEAAFFNPEPGPDAALNHLMSALWTVGVGRKHGFQLRLPQETDSLLWDGQKLHRVEASERGESLLLSIRNSPSDAGNSLLGNSRWNADVTQALAARCYTCPVPLTVDGRRIDGLQFCPSHGWSSNSFPLAYTFPEAELPELRVPSGTFEGLTNEAMKDSDGAGLGAAAEKVLEELSQVSSAPVQAILSAHLKKSEEKGSKLPFAPRTCSHICYFVQDGVVAGETPFASSPSHVSVAAFLSAEGLQTDISGFYIAFGTETQERLLCAARALSAELLSLGNASTETMTENAVRTPRRVGGAFILLGLGFSFLSPFHGISMIVAGYFGMKEGPKARLEWARIYGEGVTRLASSWAAVYPGSTVRRSP